MTLEPHTLTAINLPEHAHNIIHTDEGARDAGFPRALVAGVTVYAYLAHVPAAGWGLDWVRGGGSEVRFLAPVFHDDMVELDPVTTDDGSHVVNATVDGDVRATCVVERSTPAPGAPGAGEALPSFDSPLVDLWDNYGTRAGDDLTLFADEGIIHPAVWPALANRITRVNLVDGPWVHVRSRISHLGVAPIGSTATVSATVVDRFSSRAGERALLDVRISADGAPVAAIEHESIVRLA